MDVENIARRHHYVPQFYLARFTDKGTKKGKLFSMDPENGYVFKSTPKAVAVEKDFNRIEIEGHPPDAIEKEFAKLEGETNEAITNIVNKKEFPNNEDYNSILNFITLLVVRHPTKRKMFNDFEVK